MAKKIPSASINITSALRSVLTGTPGQPQSAVFTQSLIKSKITEAGLSAYAQLRSVIDHVVIDYAGSTYTVSIANIANNLAVHTFDSVKVVPNKGLKELLHAGDRLLPFTIGKVLKETPHAVDILKRVVSYNRKYQEKPAATDRPYKGYTKAPIKETLKASDTVLLAKSKNLKEIVRIAETFKRTVSYVRKIQDYARTLDEIGISDKSTFSDAKSLKDKSVALDKSKFTFSKTFSDYARTLDEIGISDKATFTDAKIVKDKVAEQDKVVKSSSKPFKETQSIGDGPYYATADKYAAGYFNDNYTFYSGPTFNVVKSFKDFARTLDDLQIADTATFTDVKLLKEVQLIADKNVQVFTKPIREVSKPVETFKKTLSKSFGDYVRSIDLLKVGDGITYSDRLKEQETSSTIETFSRTVNYNRAYADAPLVGDRPAITFIPRPTHDYNIYTMDSISIRRFKVLANPNDFSSTSDHLLPFNINKVLFERPQVSDILSRVVQYFRKPTDLSAPNEWTNVVKEVEGPARALDETLFATGKDGLPYFNDSYTYLPSGPTVQFSRPAQDKNKLGFDGPAYQYDQNLFANAIGLLDGDPRYFIDNVIYFGPTVQFTKRFKDFARTLDEIGIDDKTTFVDTKLIKDLPKQIDKVKFASTKPFKDLQYELDKTKISLSKSLKDFARTLDEIGIDDKTTFVDTKVVVDRNIQRDRVTKQPNKVIKDYQAESDKYKATYAKVLKDFARTLDEIGIDDKTTFVDVKTLKDYQPTIERQFKGFTLSTRRDYQTSYDKPSKGFTLGLRRDNQPLGFEGPAYQNNPNLYAVDYFVDNVIYFGPTVTYTKVLKDFQRTTIGPQNYNFDNYVPGYTDPTFISDGQVVINKTKILRDTPPAYDRPYKTFGLSTRRDYQVLQRDKSTTQFTKFIKDFAGTLDEINIDDRVTFTEAKVLKELQIQREKLSILTIKVLRDFARTLDEIGISDKVTFAETKAVSDARNQQKDKSTTSLTKSLKDFARTLDEIGIDDKATVVESKVLKDYQPTIERLFKGFTLSTRRDYQVQRDKNTTQFTKFIKDFVGTLDEINIDDRVTFTEAKVLKELQIQRETLKFSTIKILRDFARSLDDIQIADTATFAEIKPLSDSRNQQRDKATLAPTKALKDYQPQGFEGPAYRSDSNLYATGYFVDDVLYYGPTFNTSKALKDYQPETEGPTYNNQDIFANAIGLPDNDPRYFIDIYTNYTGPTVTYAKSLKDFARTLDEIGIDDRATVADTKLIKDAVKQIDKATFAPTKALKELQYQTDHIGPFSTVKVLKDFARTLDDIGISDTATFAEIKPLSDSRNQQRDKAVTLLTKSLKDFARTLDEIGIDDRTTFTDVKVINDFQGTIQGPRNYNFDNYVPGYTDPTYISDGQVVINKIKILQDFARTLDDIGIADTATFSDSKPFSDPRNYQIDKATRQPTKVVTDISVIERDHIGPFSLTKALKDFATTIDEIGIDDKVTFVEAKRLVDRNIQRDKVAIQSTKILRDWVGTLDETNIDDKATFTDVKVVHDYQPEGFEGPAYRSDSNLYATGYFVDDVLYYGPVFNSNKALKEYQPEFEGPTYNNQDIFANAIGLPDNDPRYFIDIYTNYTGPSFVSNKVLRDFARTLDDIGISDTATFSETKVFSDARNQQLDKAKFAPTKALKELQYQTDHIGPFSTVKVLKDFARTLDDIGISDTSTFAETKVLSDARNQQIDKLTNQITKSLKDFARTLDDIGIADTATFTEVKVIHDFQRTKEGPQDYNFDNYVPGYTDPTYISDGQVVISKIKEFKDFARTLDDIGIADTATFAESKPFSDPRNYQIDKATRQPTKSVKDISVYEMDHIGPFNFTKSIVDFVSQRDELLFGKPLYLDRPVQPEKPFDKLAIQSTKILRDWTGTLDDIGIADTSTFADNKPVKDYQPQGFEGPAYHNNPDEYAIGYFVDNVLYYGPTFNSNKALKDYQPETQGPTYNNQDIFANAVGLPDNDPRYFIDIYTNYTGPSFNSIKVLKDFAVTLDDIGISDTATFAETKVLSDTRNQQRDKAKFAPVKALKELQYQTDHIGPFSTVKVLKDFARTLDEIGISDKATFTDNKVIADALNPQPDKTKFQTIKALKDFARTLDEIGIDDKANYIDLKVIHDFQRTKEGPQDYNFDNYVPGYTDPTYISDGQVVISKLKELKDFAVTLDDIGISDTATFTDVKPFSDPRNQQLDKAAKQPTKSVRDISVYEMDHIGPFTVTKALKDFARTLDEIGISDKATFVDAKLLVDTNIQRDKTAIQLSRTFRDWTGTLDEIGINDKSTFVDTKVVRDYQPQGFEGPAYRKDSNLYATGYFVDDVLYYGPTFNTNKALKEYAPSAEGPTYNNQDIFANAIGLPDNDPRYFIDLYTLYTGPTVVYSKLLKDFAVTFDDLGVSDTSTFTDTKPFSEPRNYQVDKSINIYYKAVKDFARTIDDIGISDKATFTDVKPLRELFAVPFDKPAKSFSRKVTDFARTLDDIGVSDTSTFTDTKPFKEAINPQIDRSVKTYSKSIKDFVYQYDRLARYKPLFPDAPIQPEKPFDKAAVSFSRKVTDFAKTLDEIGIDDKAKYIDLKVIKDFQRTKEGPSYYNFNNYVPGYTDPTYIDDGQVVINKIKSLKDYQVQLEGPAYDNQDLYAKATGLPDGDSRYFIDPYTFYSGPVFNTNKKLKDFSTQFNTGLVSNWNYTTTVGNAVFFNEDFVGVSYIIN